MAGPVATTHPAELSTFPTAFSGPSTKPSSKVATTASFADGLSDSSTYRRHILLYRRLSMRLRPNVLQHWVYRHGRGNMFTLDASQALVDVVQFGNVPTRIAACPAIATQFSSHATATSNFPTFSATTATPAGSSTSIADAIATSAASSSIPISVASSNPTAVAATAVASSNTASTQSSTTQHAPVATTASTTIAKGPSEHSPAIAAVRLQ